MGERVLKEHIEAERMRSPAPTAESVSQHRHRSQSPPKKKDKKQKKDKKKKKKRSRSEDPRGSQILSGTPPLRTQSEERAIDEELEEQLKIEIEQPKPAEKQFAIKIEDVSESEEEQLNNIPVRQPSIVVEDETFKPKKDKKKKEKKDKKKKKKKRSRSEDPR